MKKTLHYTYVIHKKGIAPNVRYDYYKHVLSGESEPYMIIINRTVGNVSESKLMRYDSMNIVMQKSINANFRRWTRYHIIDTLDFDPKFDRVVAVD